MAIKRDGGFDILAEASDRLDSFVNILTGQGDATIDKGAAWEVQSIPLLSMPELKKAYRSSYYVRRVVDLLADDSVVRGWKTISLSDPDASEDPRWGQVNDRYDIPGILSKASKWGRAYGTGYIIPITYDLQPLNKPISLDLLYDVQDIVVLDPDECKVQDFWSQDTASTRLTEPAAFKISAGTQYRGQFSGRWGKLFAGQGNLHPSRVIPIIGAPLSTFDRIGHPYALGDSILQAMWLALARADGIDAAAALLAQEMKQDVVKIPDLKAIGTSDAKEAFRLRMRLLKLSKGLLNMIVLGAGEEYESRATSVQGFKDLSQNARDALVAATGYPEPILFGKATSGLATAPGTEQEAYMRKVETQQLDIRPALVQIYRLVAASKMGPFGGDRKYLDFKIEFNPLIRETNKDRDARTLIHAQRDSIHAGMVNAADPTLGAAFVKYIVASRYGENGWQDALPPFRPQDWMEPEPPPEPAPADPAPADDEPAAPQAPDGQKPKKQDPQGQAKPVGAQGVDLQVINTGKGQFDRKDSQLVLTEWVEIDAETYEGETYELPEQIRQSARQTLSWKTRYPKIQELLTDTEWRLIQQLATREIVGERTLQHMVGASTLMGEYLAASKRAAASGKPWEEPSILRLYGVGGTTGIDWAMQSLTEA